MCYLLKALNWQLRCRLDGGPTAGESLRGGLREYPLPAHFRLSLSGVFRDKLASRFAPAQSEPPRELPDPEQMRVISIEPALLFRVTRLGFLCLTGSFFAGNSYCWRAFPGVVGLMVDPYF